MNRLALLFAVCLLAGPRALASGELPVEAQAPREVAVPRAGELPSPEPSSEARVALPGAPAGHDPLLEEPVREPLPEMAGEGMGDLLGSFARTMLMLCVVLGLVYLTLHKGVGKLVQRSQSGKRMRVVERVGLDPRRTLYIVEVDGREMLLGTGEGGMVHLAELGGPASTAQSTAQPSPHRPFVDTLEELEEARAARAKREGAA